MTFHNPAVLILFVAAGVLVSGCRRDAPSASSPSARPGPALTNLQAELDSFRSDNLEWDPAKRPPVRSERMANRRDWALRALETGYAREGHANARWDAPLRAAFAAYADYSRAGATDRQYVALTNALQAAEAAGCRDPMLRYMRLRYGLDGGYPGWEQYAVASLRAFRAVFESPYHPAFKFIAGYRAVRAARDADSNSNRGGALRLLAAAVQDVARDTNAPSGEIFEAAFNWLDLSSGEGWASYATKDLLPIMQRNWGRGDDWFRWRGLLEVKLAWDDRGGGFANTVAEAGWEGFRQHLQQAQSALETSWDLNPSNAYTAYLMMQVELGQGKGRDRMELWFERAMGLATNYYEAAKLMSFYLEPRWYGSEDAALEFARSCVASTNWGGTVPLVLTDVHRSLATYQKLKESPEYWHRPEVWEDMRSSYERFFALNPGAAAYRLTYARDAYLCGQYGEFLAQAKVFPWTNFDYFGGEERFRQMLAHAAASARPGPQRQP